ncbi:MAG: hypothetical protein HRU08_14070, partial [Oleispira sp.]|nr:hypothetical protein [Oleispira sp.]
SSEVFEVQGCTERVVRGGHWHNLMYFLRSSNRLRTVDLDTGNEYTGFRLARTPTKLQGDWTSNCLLSSDGVRYDIVNYVFRSNNFSSFTQKYTDSNCTSVSTASGHSETYSGTYSIGSDVTLSSGLTASELDLNIEQGTNIDSAKTVKQIVYLGSNYMYLGKQGADTAIRPIDFNANKVFTKN